MTNESAASWMTALSLLASALSASEWMVNHHVFLDGGALDWRLSFSTREKQIRLPGVIRSLVSNPKGIRAVIIAHFALSAGAILLFCLGFRNTWLGGMIAVDVAAILLIHYRSVLGLDGSDQMLVVCLVASALFWISEPGSIVRPAVISFVACQLILSYLTAGLAKLVSPQWRSKTALQGIFSTHTYSRKWVAVFLNGHDRVALAMSWCIILWECSFPGSLIWRPAAIVFMAVGVLFHLMNAFIMGLNVFLWAFAASYPCFLWAVDKLHDLS